MARWRRPTLADLTVAVLIQFLALVSFHAWMLRGKSSGSDHTVKPMKITDFSNPLGRNFRILSRLDTEQDTNVSTSNQNINIHVDRVRVIPLPFSNDFFFQNQRAYQCSDLGPKYLVAAPDTQAPNQRCLGGKESWGRCSHGNFLCEQGVAFQSAPIIKYGAPFSSRCIDRVCEVHGFRYDPALTSKFCPSHGICFGCYAWRSNSTSEHFCDPGHLETFSDVTNIQTSDYAEIYVPDTPPLNSIKNGRDTVLEHEEDSVSLFATTAAPQKACSRVVDQLAILAFLDGTNPFHHLLMVYRRMFASLMAFRFQSSREDLANCVVVAWRGPDPEQYHAKWRDRLDPLTNMTPFDHGIVTSLCRGGLLVLPHQEPVCFRALVVGSTPGGWDMDLEPDQRAVAINFAGVALARLVKESVLARAALAPARPEGVLLVVRRGRRELVNEAAARDAVAGRVAPATVRVIEFDRLDFRAALSAVSARRVMVGVHGAGLANLIFLPPSAGVVEIAIAAQKQEYRLLAHSFAKRYYAHQHLVPTDEHLPDPRSRRVTVDRLPDLARLCADALSIAERMAQQPDCC